MMGCTLKVWLEILWESRFAVDLNKIPTFLFTTVNATIKQLLAWVEKLVYHRQIEQTQIKHAPVFVIGHWRSGTTLLHELLALDEQFTYPDTFQCFSPHTFLFPGSIFRKIVGLALPKTRPMDAMPMGTRKPQEDEFALCTLGAPSPYRGIMFPKLLKQYARYLRIEDLPQKQQDHWKDTLIRFLTKLSMRSDKRIVLKSPTHSFRIGLLHRMFPDARFIYIRRNPYTVYKSTLHLWMTLLTKQGLQNVDPEIVEAHVKQAYIDLLDAVEMDKSVIPADQFCEVSYEELVSHPVNTMEKIYAGVNLDGFEGVREQFVQFEEQNSGYKTNRFDLKEEEITELNRLWGEHITRQGYDLL